MSTRLSFFVFLLSILCLVAPLATCASDVITLTNDNFDELTKEGSWILEFYAPWCGHCKTLAPVYEQAATQLRGTMNLAKIDATVEQDIAKRYGIRGYPTLKFLRDGEIRTYTGTRTVEGIAQFARDMTGPSVSDITTKKDLNSLTKRYPVSVVFAGKKGPERRVFEKLAYRLQGVHKFFIVEDPAIIAALPGGANGDKPFVIHLTRGGDNERFQGPWEDSNIRQFVDQFRFPLISTLDGNNFDDITTAGRRVVYIVLAGKDDSGDNLAYVENLLPLAKKYKEHFIFATVDGARFNKYISQYGVNFPADLPTTVVIEEGLEDFFTPSTPHPLNTVQKVSSYLEDVVSGSSKPTNTVPWYNPTRYLKAVEKYLSKLPYWQVIIISVVAMLLIVGSLFFCCIYGMGSEEEMIAEMKAERARRKKERAERIAKGEEVSEEEDEEEDEEEEEQTETIAETQEKEKTESTVRSRKGGKQ